MQLLAVIYDTQVFDIIDQIQPSERGEFEITAVNNACIACGLLQFSFVRGRWTDAGTFESLNDIDHTKTKVKSPQTNGICERFHITILQEFYQITFRNKLYEDLDALQKDLDEWLVYYNNKRTHQGKMCCGRTPMEMLIDGKKIWQEKLLN